jgi:hypothetical protein
VSEVWHPETRTISAVVHFTLKAPERVSACDKAAGIMGDEIERSELIGCGGLGTVRLTNFGAVVDESTFDATGIVMFEVVDDGTGSVREIADAMLENEIAGSPVFREGAVAYVEPE